MSLQPFLSPSLCRDKGTIRPFLFQSDEQSWRAREKIKGSFRQCQKASQPKAVDFRKCCEQLSPPLPGPRAQGRGSAEVAVAENRGDAGERGPQPATCPLLCSQNIQVRKGEERCNSHSRVTFCMLLRSSESIPGVSGCRHRSSSCFPSGRCGAPATDTCALSRADVPSPQARHPSLD